MTPQETEGDLPVYQSQGDESAFRADKWPNVCCDTRDDGGGYHNI